MLRRRWRGRSGDLFAVLCLLGLATIACKLSSLPGAKMNLFEGTNALDGATKIKQKLGVDDLKIKYLEIHEDRMEVTIQDPAKPKNFDEYTYSKGVLSGPKPVAALVLGDQEFTADKSKLFSLSEIDLGQVPEVCRKASERAQVEDGKPELISIDWGNASLVQSKAEKAQRADAERKDFERQARSGTIEDRLRLRLNNLVVVWRVWIKGPRATKDYWFDAKGKLSEEPY
ncbi:MAG TPA: hypothetical protein VGN90_06370 [Pyrinomonadaceae bacterium]|nr:hypothetical protein [Pyrinomonadaceae bacterium]